MSLTSERRIRKVEPPIIPHAQLGAADIADTARFVAAALAENRVHCAFQPVVSSSKPNVVAFYECLARIIDRNGEIIPAGRFIPSVEDTDMGRLIDRAVLRQVIDALLSTRRVRLSVNISARGLGDTGWLDILREANQQSPGICDFLIVEVTESAFLNLTDPILEFLAEIRALGCSIAVDDFGAGHTSIGHLARFRFDFLKIDGSFVRGISRNRDNQFLVRSMVSIARHFEMVSVAEMVDSDEDIALLRHLGVDCLQGFHIGMPIMQLPDDVRHVAAN